MDLKFSILIPAYKKRYLSKAINSCLNQTYNNFEIIIVNDASPENLIDVVAPFLKDPRIIYRTNHVNCGAKDVVDNWNICLNYSSGEFVLCMGDDDMLMPDCLLEYYNAIVTYPEVDVFHMRVKQIDENDDVIRVLGERPVHESTNEAILGRIKGRQQYIGDFIFRTEKLKQSGGFLYLPFAWGSDDITVFKSSIPNGICNINNPLFCYRISRYTISNSGNEKEKLKAALSYEEWIHNYIEKCLLNDEDSLAREIRHLEPYMLSKIQEYIILPSVVEQFLNIWKWYRLRILYKISILTIMRTLWHRILLYK